MTIPNGATHILVSVSGSGGCYFKLHTRGLKRYSDFLGWVEFHPFGSIDSLLRNPRMRKLNPTIEVFSYEDST